MLTQFKLKPQATAALTVIRGALEPRREIDGLDLITPMDASQSLDLSLFQRAALDALRRGQATETDTNNLAVAANISMVLCERGFGAEYLPDVMAAQDALVRILARAARTGRYAADGPGLQALAQFVEIHEAQIAPGVCMQADVISAVQEVQNRRAAGQVIEVRA
jgi:hypothetical protein